MFGWAEPRLNCVGSSMSFPMQNLLSDTLSPMLLPLDPYPQQVGVFMDAQLYVRWSGLELVMTPKSGRFWVSLR